MKMLSLDEMYSVEHEAPRGSDPDYWNKRATKAIREYAASPEPVFRCVTHVRNGKPLTAVGARLLGVPWNGAHES